MKSDNQDQNDVSKDDVDDQGNILLDSHIKIFDPETQEVFLETRE